MTSKQQGALRSLGRSALFALVPVLLSMPFLTAFMSQEKATVVALVAGALIRAVWPNLLGKRG